MAQDQFLEMARNLARFHREHEKFYARAPLEEAAALQRTSAALRALAAESAVLVHANERRWRVFKQRVEECVGGDEQRAS